MDGYVAKFIPLLAFASLLIATPASADDPPEVAAQQFLDALQANTDPVAAGAGDPMMVPLGTLADSSAPAFRRARAAQRLYTTTGAYLDAITGGLGDCGSVSSFVCENEVQFERVLTQNLGDFASLDPSSGYAAFAGALVEVSEGIIDDIDHEVFDYEHLLPDENQALIWQGFTHRWGYNHRLNRLGDWVSGKTLSCEGGVCEGKAKHTGASGSGPDDLDWTSYSTFVSTRSAEFEHQFVDLKLATLEGLPIVDSQEVVVETDEPNSVAILRGFDIVSPAATDADKLWLFSVGVVNEWYDAANGEFHFTVATSGSFDCDSAECQGEGLFNGPPDALFDYDVRVYTTVVSGSAGEFAFTPSPTTEIEAYDWEDYQTGALGLSLDPTNEEDKAPHEDAMSVAGVGSNQYPSAALGFQRLSVLLEDDVHLLELDMSIDPDWYNPANGVYEADRTLFFKQWNADGNVNMFHRLQEMQSAPDLGLLAVVLVALPTPFDIAAVAALMGATVSEGGFMLAFCGLSTLNADLCVLEHEGAAELQADTVLLQFATGTTHQVEVDGQIFWPGLNAMADGDEALDEASIMQVY